MLTQKYSMTFNLLIIESLQVFEQKTRDCRTDTNANYELVVKDVIYHFFPQKAFHIQKICLCWVLYKTCDTNISDFIYSIDKLTRT